MSGSPRGRSALWWVGTVLLVMSVVTHLVQIPIFPGASSAWFAAGFGVAYLGLVIGLVLRWRPAEWLAVLVPTLGGTLGVLRFLTMQVNAYTVLNVLLDCVLVPCFAILLLRAKLPIEPAEEPRRRVPDRARRRAGWRVVAGSVAVLLAGAVTLAFGGPAAAGTAATVPASVQTWQIAPPAADPRLGPGSPSVAMREKNVPSNGLLYVFLPGTGATPHDYLQVAVTAAQLGYHVVGLTYDNSIAVGNRCLTDPDCPGRIRQNVLTGTAPDADSSVPPLEGIEHRLAATVRYLEAHDPGQGWSAFLNGDQPNWPSIVLGGHSQGGGEAAYTGTVRPLAGETLFAAPVDATWFGAGPAASWVSHMATGKTPPDRITLFNNRHDIFFTSISTALRASGLERAGPPVQVDTSAPPYHGAPRLETGFQTAPLFSGPDNHASVAADEFTPRTASGAPEFLPVWTYMLRHPITRR